MGDKFLGLFIEKTFYNELFSKLKSHIYLHGYEKKLDSTLYLWYPIKR